MYVYFTLIARGTISCTNTEVPTLPKLYNKEIQFWYFAALKPSMEFYGQQNEAFFMQRLNRLKNSKGWRNLQSVFAFLLSRLNANHVSKNTVWLISGLNVFNISLWKNLLILLVVICIKYIQAYWVLEDGFISVFSMQKSVQYRPIILTQTIDNVESKFLHKDVSSYYQFLAKHLHNYNLNYCCFKCEEVSSGVAWLPKAGKQLHIYIYIYIYICI
jgi:hypothetical protein